MSTPTDPWATIGQAESLIRQVLTRSTELPADMTSTELYKLEEIMEALESMLKVTA